MENRYKIKKIDFCEVCHKPKPEEEIKEKYEIYEIFGRIKYETIRKCLKCLKTDENITNVIK